MQQVVTVHQSLDRNLRQFLMFKRLVGGAGQKARVALARAAYAQPSVVLMDDPLSAVDPRVGRILFDQSILGIMAPCTRLLVTHQRQFLPRYVVILSGD